MNSIVSEDASERYGEPRFVSIGATLYVLVWTERRDDLVRVISLRKANKQERKRHEDEI